MEHLELNANAYLPLRDVVFHTLREAILRGDLKPGERLMELQLASQLGVSRTPIREAIRMLQQEGLAVTIPRRGAEVAGMTEKDMEDVLRIRKALEILAGQLACEKMDGEREALLHEKLNDFERAVATSDLKQIAQTDVEFHRAIYAAADNARLETILGNLQEQVYRYRVEYLKDEKNYPRLLEEHREIVRGLNRKDSGYVADMMKRHMDNQEQEVKNIIRRQE